MLSKVDSKPYNAANQGYGGAAGGVSFVPKKGSRTWDSMGEHPDAEGDDPLITIPPPKDWTEVHLWATKRVAAQYLRQLKTLVASQHAARDWAGGQRALLNIVQLTSRMLDLQARIVRDLERFEKEAHPNLRFGEEMRHINRKIDGAVARAKGLFSLLSKESPLHQTSLSPKQQKVLAQLA